MRSALRGLVVMQMCVAKLSARRPLFVLQNDSKRISRFVIGVIFGLFCLHLSYGTQASGIYCDIKLPHSSFQGMGKAGVKVTGDKLADSFGTLSAPRIVPV